MKRFYKAAAVADDHGILLDGRPVRTPRKALLRLPTRSLADAVCEEWQAQTEEIDPRTMPLTGLANAAIDIVMADPDAFATPLTDYADSDLLYYREDSQPALAERQTARWDPLLDWATRQYDISFVRIIGLMPKPQPQSTRARLAAALRQCSPFELAAMSQLVTISGSLIIAMAIRARIVSADDGFDLGHLDELYQAELWGEDWMAADARTVRRADFVSAARFLALLGDG